MKVEIIDPKQSLVEKAGEILLEAGSLADNLAVFPGKRPAHFLRKYLAEKKGSAFKAPVITSMDGFIDLAAEELGFNGAPASQLDLAYLLYDRLKTQLCQRGNCLGMGGGPGHELVQQRAARHRIQARLGRIERFGAEAVARKGAERAGGLVGEHAGAALDCF